MPKTTAVILCGGRGERLRPFTDHMPKPLLPLNGHPILYYLLDLLNRQSVHRFVLCTGYRAECIDEFVRTRCPEDWQIQCVNSGEAPITKRLQDAWPHVSERILICYGDTLANVDIRKLITYHERYRGIATMTLYRPRSSFGVVKFDQHRRVRCFEEKPRLPQWINIGFIVCEKPEVEEILFQSSDMVEFLSRLAETKKLFAYRHDGKHLTINTEKERKDAESEAVEFLSVPNTY